MVTLIVAARMPHRFMWPRFKALRGTLKFSANFLMGQLAWYGYSNSDFVVAGRVLGRAALGEYTLAWTLTSAPGDKIMSVFGRVMPMMLAAVQRDTAALRRYFFLFTETLALMIVPATIGLALVAPDFVLLVFGAKWSAIVMPLRLLCIYTAIHIIATPTTPVLQVTGQPGFPARCGVATLFILPPAFYFAGERLGTVGIAAIWLTVYPLILIPVFVRVFRTLELRLRDYAACLAPTLAATALMAGAVLAVRTLSPQSSVAERFAMQVAFGAITFAAITFVIQKRRLSVLAEFVRSLRS